MRLLAPLSVVSALLASLWLPIASVDPPPHSQTTSGLQPTELEAFAAMPTAMVVWASPIGRLDSPQSRAIVTAVALEDRETQEVKKGLRIDLMHLQPDPDCNLRWLSHSDWCARENAAMYFGEDVLERLRVGVERGNAENNLIISFSAGGAPGLIVAGYQFDGLQPDELTNLIEIGVLELANAPRQGSG